VHGKELPLSLFLPMAKIITITGSFIVERVLVCEVIKE